MDILDWLSEWFNYHCDNNWEHEYGYRICNMDNPGVLVEIDRNKSRRFRVRRNFYCER
jgi:hypothetical protein